MACRGNLLGQYKPVATLPALKNTYVHLPGCRTSSFEDQVGPNHPQTLSKPLWRQRTTLRAAGNAGLPIPPGQGLQQPPPNKGQATLFPPWLQWVPPSQCLGLEPQTHSGACLIPSTKVSGLLHMLSRSFHQEDIVTLDLKASRRVGNRQVAMPSTWGCAPGRREKSMRWGSQKDTRGKTGAWSCNFISRLPVATQGRGRQVWLWLESRH